MGTALRVRRPLVRAIGGGQSDTRQAAWFSDARVSDASPADAKASAPAAGLGWVDLVLIFIFMVGLYTNYTIMLSSKVPLPSVPAGIAGLILLVRRRNDITPRALIGFCAIVTLYLASMLCAPDISWLSRRTNGLIQLTYSLAVGYALFLTVKRAERRQIARLFLAFALVIVVGCLLENYGGLRPVSDAVRNALYRKGIYENDLRDLMFYNRVRPKFFASEPASVTFCYTLFTFIWLVASPWRWKLPLYLGLVGLGLFAMPGPTLLLMLVLLLPYLLFLGSRRNGRIDAARFLVVALVAVLFSLVALLLAKTLFAQRFEAITSGNDPSFFYRVQGPALAGLDIMSRYPIAGAGLSGEPVIEREITNLYLRSSYYSGGWKVVSPATELLINYFWLHWIYLGFVWGVAMIAVISGWLRVLGVPSAAFCWVTWAILGQASGAYVGPTCWAVLFLAAAACLLNQRTAVAAPAGWQPAPDEWAPPAPPVAMA
ncbi:hypothetical protein SAMN02990966_03336 [Rhodospirillales bacterium URHD0017]|nr:hypothetical protein SAMN02990966_03336 [Rhodospirillales bacterium URHD0017]